MKPKFAIFLVVIFLAGVYNLHAQTLSPNVTPTQGGYASSGSVSLSWTMGQSFNPTITGGSTELSQGFEQPEVDIITGAVTGGPFCSGGSINVPFTSPGFVDGTNVFTAQLSDASGSFASPVTLGTLNSIADAGIITGTLPTVSSTGTGYLVRVVSSAPVYTGKAGSASITINPLPAFTASGTDVTCYGLANGQITITVTSGASPFSYSLTGAAPFSYSASPITSLGPNTYNVLVQDNNGCIAATSQPVTISQPAALGAATISETDESCFGGSDGTVTISTLPTGGTGSYQYSLNGGTYQSGTGFMALTTGSYSVITKDANGCMSSASNSVSIGQPVATTASASNTGPYVDGQTISLTASSSGAVSYVWSGPAGYSASGQTVSRSLATSAMAGTYTVIATTAAGCTATATTDVVVTSTAAYVWTGTTSTDWTVPTNWSPTAPVGGPNACAIDVIIGSVTNNPVISSLVTVGNIQLNAGALLTLNGANINVCKNVTGGTGSNATVAGTGTVILNGSAAQTFSGMAQMQELMVNNTAGVSMQNGSSLDLFTSLDLNTGNFDATNGTLTFKSNTVDSVAILDNFSHGYTGTISGNITAERYYASSTTENQHYMGSPINSPSLVNQFGATGIAGQVTDTYCDETQSNYNSPYGTVFQLNQTLGYICGIQQWSVVITGNAQNGLGYSLLKPGTGKLVLNGQANLNDNYPISGLLNTGWSNTTLQGRPQTSGWQLLSNPYLATLDISTVPTGFDNQVQVWITNGPFADSYQSSLVGTNAAVAPFQGFMVHKTAVGGSATYTLNATDKVQTPATFYQQNANELKIVAANTATGLLDQTTVAFNTAATDTFDAQYDAQKLLGSLGRHTIYTQNNNKWMAINTLNNITTTSTVPVGFEPGKTGAFTFNFNGVNTFDPTSYIYLEDRTTTQWYNVRNGNYNFTADSADGWNRFVLHFTPPAQINTTDATCNTGGTINIQQPGNAYWNYTLTDSNSNVVASGTLNQTQPVTLQAASGTYTLTLTDTNNYVAVKTIQVNGPVPVSAAFMVSADTVIPQQTVVVVANTPDAASYLWNFGDGNTATGSQAMVSYTQPGVYVLSLQVTNNAGCSSIQTHSVTVKSNAATGLKNISGTAGISIWSNANRVYVDFTQLHDVDAVVSIYNILGQEICNEHYTNNNVYQKEINSIEAAYMIVMVRNNNEITTKKVLINNL